MDVLVVANFTKRCERRIVFVFSNTRLLENTFAQFLHVSAQLCLSTSFRRGQIASSAGSGSRLHELVASPPSICCREGDAPNRRVNHGAGVNQRSIKFWIGNSFFH